MNIGLMFGGKENSKSIAGINRTIRATVNEIIKNYPGNIYSSIYDNYLNLRLKEYKYYYVDVMKRYDYVGMKMINGLDIIHSMFESFDYMYNDVKKIITIHDIIALNHPEWFPKNTFVFFDERIRRSAEMADAIMTCSDATKRDVVKYFDIPESKIHTIYWGVESTINYNNADISIIDKFGLRDGYVLSVCTIEPRKNLKGTIKAFIQYKKNSNSKVKLALCGKMGWDEEFEAFYDSLGQYKNDVVILGYVSDDELGALYKHALAFVYNSFYEGFGLPVLEAMTAGKAVITSDSSSLPEVGGDAVRYCNPYSVDSMADGFAKVIEDNSYRKELEEKALVQASKFSYKKTAQEIMQLYNDVLNEC